MATPSEILANIFGGQTAKPMSDEERGMAAMGQNPAITTPEPFQPTGGAGFIPQAQVPTPAADVGRGTIMGDLANILPDAPQQFTPAATTQAIEPQSPTIGQGTVLQSPAVPSMESVGLNPLTTEPQFGGISQTPSLQPTNNVMGEAATQARLGAMFGEAPQTLSQVTAQDPASIAAQQATQAFEAESAAREARLGSGLSVRPGIDVPSLDMQRKRMEAGLSPTAGAPMGTDMSQQQQADMLERGFDPATGQKIGGDMTDYQRATLAQRQQQFEATQANINREWEAGQAALAEEKAQGIAATQESIQKETDRLDSQLGFLEGAAMEMAGLSNWTTEGVIGASLGKLPFETNKKQVDRIANSFMGNAFLRSIIDSKSLGATFGALSNQEGEKITGAETILTDGSMSNERRLRAAADIINTIKSAKARAQKRMAKTQSGSQPSQDTAPVGEAPQMEGFTFKVKN